MSKAWGSRQPDGKWTGLIGMLFRNETDLGAAELMMTSDRLDAVDFTTPVFSTKLKKFFSINVPSHSITWSMLIFTITYRCRAFIKRPYYTAVKWTAYSDPFYAGIWISLIVVMVISSAFILIGFKVSPKRIYCRREEIEASFADTFFQTFGAICAQGRYILILLTRCVTKTRGFFLQVTK